MLDRLVFYLCKVLYTQWVAFSHNTGT